MAAIFAPPRVTIILLNFVTYTFIDFKIYIYIYIYNAKPTIFVVV